MKILERAAIFIMPFEELRLKSYVCPAGVLPFLGSTKGVTPDIDYWIGTTYNIFKFYGVYYG